MFNSWPAMTKIPVKMLSAEVVSLVLVQPREARPFITEYLLMGRKESNQTKTKVVCCM